MTKTDAARNKWTDLAPRVVSAVVMAGVAALLFWLGGVYFAILLAVVIGASFWELTRLLGAGGKLAVVLGLLAAMAIMITHNLLLHPVGKLGGPLHARMVIDAVRLVPVVVLAVPIGLGTILIPTNKHYFLGYAALIMLSAIGFFTLSQTGALLWLILVVIASDVAGYFAGRVLGGAKFWPAVSPKKTWSGTIAGWLAAAIVGALYWFPHATFFWAAASVLLAFSGQMGDILESAMKRKMGVKDSSNLIPGHGGVLDRFDAMIGAGAASVIIIAASWII